MCEALDQKWDDAVEIADATGDFGPFLLLLRSSATIPTHAREFLADLIDGKTHLNHRLVAKRTDSFKNRFARHGETLRTGFAMHREIEAGTSPSVQAAAEKVAESESCADRTVYTRWSKAKAAVPQMTAKDKKRE